MSDFDEHEHEHDGDGDGDGPELTTCPRCGAQYLVLAAVTTCVDCGARLRGGGEDDEVGYDLADWSAEQRAELVGSLAAEGVVARLEDTELVVAEADAAVAEELIEEVDAPDALDAEEDDGDAAARVLSSLYVTSDVLVRDPDSSAAVVELLESVEAAADLPLPYGLDGDVWSGLLRAADELADLLGAAADDEDVAAAARRLRDAVRPLV
jgi:hypothetical protein